MSPKDFPAARQAEKHRRKAADAERAVADLRDRRKALAAELEEVGSDSAHSAFSTFVARGEVQTKARTADAVQAEIEQIDAMITAGEVQIAAAHSHAKEADGQARREWVAAMTMADAIEFARDALARIDLVAASAEFDELEKVAERLHQPRLHARDVFAAASAREADLLRRYHGLPDARDGLTPAEAKAASAKALAEITRLRDSVESSRRRHQHAREDLVNKVNAAFIHMGRLAQGMGKLGEAYAKGLASAASALSRGRLDPSMFPTTPEFDVPSRAAIAELSALARPVLELSRRAMPPQRSDSEYAPPRLY